MIGHKALGEGLKTIFVENGLMREGEPERIVALFRDFGVHVQLVDARDEFFERFKGNQRSRGEARSNHSNLLQEGFWSPCP